MSEPSDRRFRAALVQLRSGRFVADNLDRAEAEPLVTGTKPPVRAEAYRLQGPSATSAPAATSPPASSAGRGARTPAHSVTATRPATANGASSRSARVRTAAPSTSPASA